jgi:hypothetical protein
LKALGAAILGALAKAGDDANDNTSVTTANLAAKTDQPFFMVRAIPPWNSRRATLSRPRYGNVKGRRMTCCG